MARRERTHQLIELGGLVRKSGLEAALTEDRAALFGALLELADRTQAADGVHQIALWRRRGQRQFEIDEAGLAAARALRGRRQPTPVDDA